MKNPGWIVMFFLASLGAHANEMSWEDIVRIAAEKNYEQKNQRSIVLAYEFQRKANFGEYFPHISFSAKKSDSNTSLLGETSRKKADDYGLETSWILFSGFSTSATVAKNVAEINEKNTAKDLSEVDLRYELRLTYYKMLIALENIRLYKKIRDRENNGVRFMQLKYKSGAEALWSLNQAKADLETAEQYLIEAKADYESLKQNLNYLLGLDYLNFDVSGEIESHLQNNVPIKPANQHPARLNSLAKQEMAEQEIRFAKSAYFPTISAAYSLKKVRNDLVPNHATVSTVGINVSIPIFNGLTTKHRVESASAERDAAEIDSIDISRKIEYLQRSTEIDFIAKLRAIPVAKHAYLAAKDRMDTVSEQYKLGLKKFLDWEQAQAKLLDAEKEEIRVKKEALLSRAEWERALALKLGE